MSGPTDLALSIDGDDGDELHELREWLVADDDLRDVPVAMADSPIDAGHMGFISDALLIGVPNAIAAGQLALALVAWWPTRRKPRPVRLTVGGRTVEITGVDDPKTLAALLTPLLEAPDAGP